MDWRGSFGEAGHYVSPHTIEWRVGPGGGGGVSGGGGSVGVVSPSGRRSSSKAPSSSVGGAELEVVITPPAAPLVVGFEGGVARCAVYNRTGRTIEASLSLEAVESLNSAATSGILVSGLTTRLLGALQPQSSVEVELELMPLAAGVHGLGGVAVLDRKTGKTYRAPTVTVLVEAERSERGDGEGGEAEGLAAG